MSEWIFALPKAGDHIRVDRGGYYHHGVYVGDGAVIHYSAPEGDGITLPPECILVRRDSLAMFAGGGNIEVRRYDRKEKKELRTPEQIVSYADSCIGRGGYDILYRNCEHFALECTGLGGGTQIDALRRQIREKLGKNDTRNT